LNKLRTTLFRIPVRNESPSACVAFEVFHPRPVSHLSGAPGGGWGGDWSGGGGFGGGAAGYGGGQRLYFLRSPGSYEGRGGGAGRGGGGVQLISSDHPSRLLVKVGDAPPPPGGTPWPLGLVRDWVDLFFLGPPGIPPPPGGKVPPTPLGWAPAGPLPRVFKRSPRPSLPPTSLFFWNRRWGVSRPSLGISG